MNFNMTQVFAAWLAAALAAVLMSLNYKAPEIASGSASDRDNFILEAARIGDGSSQVVAGQLVDLLMDPKDRLAAGAEAVPFEVIDGAGGGPQVLAILIERGVPVVYIRGDQGLLTVTEGGSWNDWIVERIEADRVYFTRSGEELDYLVFATLGSSDTQPGAQEGQADRSEKAKKRAERRERKKRETKE